MDLIPNGLYQCSTAPGEVRNLEPGLYRVVVYDPSLPKAALVFAQPLDGGAPRDHGGRRKLPEHALKRPRKKARPASVGQIYWVPCTSIQSLWDDERFRPIDLNRPETPPLSAESQADYDRRISTMEGFLDLPALQRSLLIHEDLRGMVHETLTKHSCSRSYVYKLWSLLCKFGFSATSLWPQRHRCGAPGVVRRCDIDSTGKANRRKAGRKTLKERVAAAYGAPVVAEQPGMSTAWAARILSADHLIPCPKPKWPEREVRIINSQFCSTAKEVDGKLVLVPPAKGTYPNRRQIRRVIEQVQSKIQKFIDRTTKHHFESAKRGLRARGWQGVPGPGHTWMIDSTLGDIYLRSSVDRAWVVGRPIVYVIVDLWSTAIMGYYICLTGPSWNTAKVALFCSALHPGFVGDLWGYQPLMTLDPAPTLCHRLLCDRGEYLSAGHKKTAQALSLHTAYTPPYRGDFKGLCEVLHRIEKDKAYHFWPGAMDYRREELELRTVDPTRSTLTLQDYAFVLNNDFTLYNLFADRSHRVDAHMTAAGVDPSPAGLWEYGHWMGIGYQKAHHFNDLVVNLLHREKAWVARDGVHWAGNDYTSPEIEAAQWTTLARNMGGWNLDAWNFPGSMGQIWVPMTEGGDLIRLSITDESRATPGMSRDEWLDVAALETMRKSDRVHDRLVKCLSHFMQADALRKEAAQKTAAAIDRASGRAPSMSEARWIEVASQSAHKSEGKTRQEVQAEAFEEHEAMLAELVQEADARGGSHV